MSLTYAIALAIGLVACVTDLKSRRIPNILTFGSALAGLVYHAVMGGATGFVAALVGWLIGVAVFFLPFAFGGMGGGDIKLMGALGAWLGWVATLWVALYTGVAGGVLALVVAAYRGYLWTALQNIWLLLAHWRVVGPRPLAELTLEGSNGPRLAYAVPIFAGTLLTTWLRS